MTKSMKQRWRALMNEWSKVVKSITWPAGPISSLLQTVRVMYMLRVPTSSDSLAQARQRLNPSSSVLSPSSIKMQSLFTLALGPLSHSQISPVTVCHNSSKTKMNSTRRAKRKSLRVWLRYRRQMVAVFEYTRAFGSATSQPKIVRSTYQERRPCFS